MADTTIIPLSFIDHCGLASCSTTYGYILDSVDEVKIRDVAFRVVEKWRLLAGRVEWDSEAQMYHIRVPTVGQLSDEYARVTFTRAEYARTALDIESNIFDEKSTVFLELPSIKYFRDASTPDGLSVYASHQLPLISLHISILKNCVCVGFTFPHGIFDGTGMGIIARAFDNETNGRSWEPPALQTVNMLAKVVAQGDSAPVDMAKNLSPGLRRVEANVAPLAVGNGIAFVAKLLYEKVWHRVEERTIFIGNEVVKGLVEDVKAQVSATKKGYVSTSDVLLAWVIKAAYQRELDGTVTRKASVSISSAVSMRSIFDNPAAKQYPHNGFVLLLAPQIPISDLAKATVADLAVLHRENLDEHRNLAYLQGYYALQEKLGRNVMFTTPWNVDSWVCSNQVVGRMDLLDLGTETRQFFCWPKPYMPHHGFVMNRFKSGYVLQMSMRRSRWDSVATELERLGQSAKQ